MMVARGFVLAGVLVFGAVQVLAGPVIRRGDTWTHYKGRSYPSDNNGKNWTQPGYDDSGWGAPLPSGFGYADDDDGNNALDDMQNDYISVFIRRPFLISDTSQVHSLTLSVDYDDGYVAYINGTEVWRRNMPGGTPDHTTAALSGHESSWGNGDQFLEEREWIDLDPGYLVNGTNLLTLSGHNASLGSSDFSLIPELYTNASLVRGPILHMPDALGITVTWRTDISTDGIVEYGFDGTFTEGAVTNSGPTRDHELALPVANGTNYSYRIISGGEVLYTGQLRTRRTWDQPFSFVVYGDFGTGYTNNMQIGAQVCRAGADFSLTVGDNIYLDGQPGKYDPYWFTPFSTSLAVGAVFPGFGNHEDDNLYDGGWYNDFFRLPQNGPAGDLERNYSFDYGNAHFAHVNTIRHDTNDTVLMSAINSWLASDLAATTARWKFVFFHHPPYTSEGSHGSHIPTRDNIVGILESNDVDFAFQGHNHFYERIHAINGVRYNTAGGGGQGLHGLSNRKDYSEVLINDQYTFTHIEVDGDKMTLKAITQFGGEADYLSIDKSHPFEIDGILDDGGWQRAANGLILHAAIRGPYLYVATQDAGEGSDNFIFVADEVGGYTGAPWGKTSMMMQVGAFLADENDGGFQGWFDGSGSYVHTDTVYRSETPGINNQGVMEGTIHLASHFGAWPSNLYLAAAPYETTNGGWLINASQVPATQDGDADIDPNEFLYLASRDIALDLPVADAGGDASVEAGVPVTLDGSGSYAPSGLGLSYSWRQVSGPACTITDSNQAVGQAVSTMDVASSTTAVFELVVHDSRFESNDLVAVTIQPIADGDGDGLSDYEETTGMNNLLTVPDPGGGITDAGLFDSDADGVGDGSEYIAGTSPTNGASVLEMVFTFDPSVDRVISWPSVSGRVYGLDRATNVTAPYLPFLSNLTATLPQNSYTDDATAAGEVFYRLNVSIPE